MTIELVIDEKYDESKHVVAIGEIESKDIRDMDRTVFETAPKFLIRWSEPTAKSQWKTLQSAVTPIDTPILGIEADPSKPLSAKV